MNDTHDLLLAVLGARDDVDCLHMSDIDLVAQDVREDDLGNISGECVSIEGERGPILEERTSSSGTHPNYRLKQDE